MIEKWIQTKKTNRRKYYLPEQNIVFNSSMESLIFSLLKRHHHHRYYEYNQYNEIISIIFDVRDAFI